MARSAFVGAADGSTTGAEAELFQWQLRYHHLSSQNCAWIQNPTWFVYCKVKDMFCLGKKRRATSKGWFLNDFMGLAFFDSSSSQESGPAGPRKTTN